MYNQKSWKNRTFMGNSCRTYSPSLTINFHLFFSSQAHQIIFQEICTKSQKYSFSKKKKKATEIDADSPNSMYLWHNEDLKDSKNSPDRILKRIDALTWVYVSTAQPTHTNSTPHLETPSSLFICFVRDWLELSQELNLNLKKNHARLPSTHPPTQEVLYFIDPESQLIITKHFPAINYSTMPTLFSKTN